MIMNQLLPLKILAFLDDVYYKSKRMRQENHFTLWRSTVNYTTIKIQFVPHREHSVYILKNKKSAVCREVLLFCCMNRLEHTNKVQGVVKTHRFCVEVDSPAPEG